MHQVTAPYEAPVIEDRTEIDRPLIGVSSPAPS
jgi:hypothetical protein